MTTRWVAGQHPRSSEQVTCPVAAAAQRILHDSQYSALRHVTCSLHEGRLVLHGKSPSFYLVQLAQSLVRRLPGVEQVENRIQVVSPAVAQESREPEPAPPTPVRRFSGRAWDDALANSGALSATARSA